MFFLRGKSSKKIKADNQIRLVLLVCLPCFVITAVALILADISLYLVAFVLIVLALLCSYVVVASSQNSQYQIRTLSNLIESMIDGDYTLRGRSQMNPAFQDLLTLINNLAETLSQHKLEAKESRMLLERIMEQMDAMVFATNEKKQVIMANASANRLLFQDKIERDMVYNVVSGIAKDIVDASTGIVVFSQGELSGEHFLYKESFLSEGNAHQLYLLTNAERLLMEKERKAWQSLLRVLSHEMNNSLTPITAIGQSMRDKLKVAVVEDNTNTTYPSLAEGVNIINERAESLSSFIASYSQLYHLPTPNKSRFSLKQLLDNLTPLFASCEIKINYDDSRETGNQSELDIVEADKNQLEQVLINLFKNALEAMTGTHKVIEVDVEKVGKWQQIKVKDSGSGIANLDNLFVPFYTTKPQGSGIGLSLCRQIMFNHNGLIKLSNRSDKKGAQVVLSLPSVTTSIDIDTK